MNIKDISNYFLKQAGYHEKASNKDLYTDKNNGNKNFTKYADMIKKTDLVNGNKQGIAWCAVFIIACFYDMFGEDQTHKILSLPKNSAGAGCPYLYSYLRDMIPPKEGDLIFFGKDKPTHVGYIYKVDDKKIYTVEGNSDDQVKKHSYNIGSSKIYGFGRPYYNNTIPVDDQKFKYKIIAMSGLRVRKEPNTNCEVLKVLPFGKKVIGTPYNDSWISSEGGYISSKWVERL